MGVEVGVEMESKNRMVRHMEGIWKGGKSRV